MGEYLRAAYRADWPEEKLEVRKSPWASVPRVVVAVCAVVLAALTKC